MSIEITEEKKISPLNILFQVFFGISLIVFLASSAIFVYYQFVEIPNNTKKLSDLYEYLNVQKPEEEKQTEILATSIQNYVDDYKILYKQRAKLNNFFTAFEGWVHPQVYFSSFSVDATTRIVNLKGFSSDFKPLIEQLEIIKKEPRIEKYQVSDIKMSDNGKVSFSLVLTVKPEIFK